MKITKDEMAKKAVSLFYAHGYERTTIDDICKACGVTKGSFYHHFGAKEELLPYIYKASPVLLFKGSLGNETLEASPKKRLWRMFEMAFNYTVSGVGRENMRNLWEMDLRSGNSTLSAKAFLASESIPKNTRDAFIRNIEEAKEKEEIHSNQTAEELLSTYFSAMFGISVNWSFSEEDYDVTAEMKRAFEVVFR